MVDLVQLKQVAKSKRAENERFFEKLKKLPIKNIMVCYGGLVNAFWEF